MLSRRHFAVQYSNHNQKIWENCINLIIWYVWIEKSNLKLIFNQKIAKFELFEPKSSWN